MKNYKDKYDWIKKFKNGFSKVELNGKMGLINEQGEEIIEPKYDWLNDFQNGFASARLNNKMGFVNEQGEEVGEIKYDDVYPFQNGFSLVTINDKWGWIDEKGKELIIELSFSEVTKLDFDFTQSSFYKKYLLEN